MTSDDDRPDVDIAADPAIWLRGPSPEASQEDRWRTPANVAQGVQVGGEP